MRLSIELAMTTGTRAFPEDDLYQVVACDLFSWGLSGSMLGPRDHELRCGSTSAVGVVA